jgi:hypothetical protein
MEKRCAMFISGISECGEGRGRSQPVHRTPVGLTITVEKIDRVLAGVQAQVESLQCQTINLRLVREQLAGMEDKWRSA